MTRTLVTDESNAAVVQYCQLLSNVWLIRADVTDEGITGVGQHWHSLSNVPL